jgi:hypothetical protein
VFTITVGLLELGQGLVAQDSGVVDENVDLAEGIERRLQDLLAALDRAH